MIVSVLIGPYIRPYIETLTQRKICVRDVSFLQRVTRCPASWNLGLKLWTHMRWNLSGQDADWPFDTVPYDPAQRRYQKSRSLQEPSSGPDLLAEGACKYVARATAAGKRSRLGGAPRPLRRLTCLSLRAAGYAADFGIRSMWEK